MTIALIHPFKPSEHRAEPWPVDDPDVFTTSPLLVWPPQIVMQEVPGEIALAITVLGCPHRCPGCHSPQSWQTTRGVPLTQVQLAAWLSQYHDLITCVCLMGGDWRPDATLAVLRYARHAGVKTCLYAGVDHVDTRLIHHLDYLKVGPFIAARGGLASPTTNQRFYRLPSWQLMNDHFHH